MWPCGHAAVCWGTALAIAALLRLDSEPRAEFKFTFVLHCTRTFDLYATRRRLGGLCRIRGHLDDYWPIMSLDLAA
jgi:hypothetical protein